MNLAFPSSVWELASSQALSLTLFSPRTSILAPALNCNLTSLLPATLTSSSSRGSSPRVLHRRHPRPCRPLLVRVDVGPAGPLECTYHRLSPLRPRFPVDLYEHDKLLD